jgi:hypothetical protein
MEQTMNAQREREKSQGLGVEALSCRIVMVALPASLTKLKQPGLRNLWLPARP